MIPPADLQQALSGNFPPTGRPLSLAELGRRLAPHRQGAASGQPYRKQTIAMYLAAPEKQGPDFEQAFLSWRAAEVLRQQNIRTRYNGIQGLLDELPHVVELGDGDPQALFVLRQLPPGALIDPTGPAPSILLNRSPIRTCPACNRRFIARSWNHRRCGPDCPGGSL